VIGDRNHFCFHGRHSFNFSNTYYTRVIRCFGGAATVCRRDAIA